jgi:cytoskeletal protein RodZ
LSIGDTLAQARREAGLTVTQVSERTRIRGTIIAGIERDDYSACGGDFYARGHIRSIARVVGIDPEPLIWEYDTARLGPAPEPEEVTDPVPPVLAEPAAAADAADAAATRYRLTRTVATAVAVVVALAAALSFGAYQLFAGSRHVTRAASASAARPPTHPPARHSPPASSSPAPSPTPTPASTSAPVRVLTPVSAAAFSAHGVGQGDNPQLAQDAIAGNPGAAWHTDWYNSAHFGNLYAGTGLLVDMSQTVSITAARVTLGGARGAGFQLRVGARPVLADLTPVASAADAGGVVNLRLSAPARGRYVLIWFTSLPRDPAGTFEAAVRHLELQGRA